MRLLAATVLAATLASVQASSILARQTEPTAEQQQCIETCATTAGTAHPADALSCVGSTSSLTETLQCLCSKDELWTAIEQCISKECPAVTSVLDGLCSGAIPIPEVTGSVTDILSSATESLGLGSSTSVTGGSASTPVAGTTTSGSIAPSSTPGTNPGDAAVSLRPAVAAVGAVAAVALLF